VLSAILSKPIAVVLPALFVAYEFCSGPHGGILSWRWGERRRQPIFDAYVALTAVFLAVGGVCAVIFPQPAISRSNARGWLIYVLYQLDIAMLTLAPPTQDLAAFQEGSSVGLRFSGHHSRFSA